MKRRKCREYNKNRRSARWYEMQSKYKIQLDKSKTEFYSRKISKLRRTKPKQWHRELKKLISFDQHQGEIIVESIKDDVPKHLNTGINTVNVCDMEYLSNH